MKLKFASLSYLLLASSLAFASSAESTNQAGQENVIIGETLDVVPGDASPCKLELFYDSGDLSGAKLVGWGQSSFIIQRYVDYNTVTTEDDDASPLQKPVEIWSEGNRTHLKASRKVIGPLTGYELVDRLLGKDRWASSEVRFERNDAGEIVLAEGEFLTAAGLREAVKCHF